MYYVRNTLNNILCFFCENHEILRSLRRTFLKAAVRLCFLYLPSVISTFSFWTSRCMNHLKLSAPRHPILSSSTSQHSFCCNACLKSLSFFGIYPSKITWIQYNRDFLSVYLFFFLNGSAFMSLLAQQEMAISVASEKDRHFDVVEYLPRLVWLNSIHE